ncbi:MAG: nucleotide exchange factor GrpE [Firmicutes bacterium]|nr:nucleotide exchange factor GrpE [Bacillota bacterium]
MSEDELKEEQTYAESEGLRAEVARLEAELEAKQAEAEGNFERWARTQADFENFRRRTRAEREEWVRYATEGLVLDLLPAIDNLERALKADAQAEAWRQGVELTVRQLMNVLQTHGIAPIEALGLAFNPEVHEAVMQVESADHEEGTVVTEVRRGYKLGDKVIRPSLVQVSRRPDGAVPN